MPTSTQIEKHPQDVPRGPHGLLQDRPARDRQRRDGRAPDRRLDPAQAAGRVAAGPDPRRPDRGDGQGADRERPGRQVRLQPADRDAGQRAGGGRQERRGGPALRPRPRRAPPEGGRDRAGAGADPGAQDIKTPTSGRLPMLRVSVRRDQLARYGIKAADVLDAVAALGRHDRRHRRSRGRSGIRHPGPPARVVAERPREDPARSGSSTPRAGRSRCATWPTSRSRKVRARSSARTSSGGRWSASTSVAATSPGSSPRPRPRSTAKVKLPARLPAPLGRAVRAPADRLAAAHDRRADRAGC